MHFCEGPTGTVPPRMAAAIEAMQRLFAQTEARNVGGIVVSYLIDGANILRCGYTHSVTDPVCLSLVPGDAVSHGTAERGGFGVSDYELEEHDGISVYWLQARAGWVMTGIGTECRVERFTGSPAEFVAAVKAKLARNIFVGFGEAPLLTDRAVSMLRDEQGRPIVAVTAAREGISFAWVGGGAGPFRASGNIAIPALRDRTKEEIKVAEHQIALTLSEDRRDTSIVIEGPSGRVELSANAEELDRLIESLSAIRSGLHEGVPNELLDGTRLTAVLDPAWRTRAQFASDVKGVTLVLRHPGLNWRAFLLPVHEARALGSYLVRTADSLSRDKVIAPEPHDELDGG